MSGSSAKTVLSLRNKLRVKDEELSAMKKSTAVAGDVAVLRSQATVDEECIARLRQEVSELKEIIRFRDGTIETQRAEMQQLSKRIVSPIKMQSMERLVEARQQDLLRRDDEVRCSLVSLLLCFFASLFFASLFLCFFASLLLCFFASLLLCFFASLLHSGLSASISIFHLYRLLTDPPIIGPQNRRLRQSLDKRDNTISDQAAELKHWRAVAKGSEVTAAAATEAMQAAQAASADAQREAERLRALLPKRKQ
jgi:hypothetical protein